MADKGRSTTPQASSVLEDLRVLQDRVVERIRELEPFAQELGQLREQADRLGIDLSAPAAKRPSKPTQAKRSASRKSAPRARRRRTANGQSRADQVLALVREQPGTSIPELGKALGVDSTGLYRVVRALESDGLVLKQGRQLQPVKPAGEPVAS